MSTILKALKKLEQEREASRRLRPTPVSSEPASTADGMWNRHLGHRLRQGIVGGLIVALGFWAFFFYRHWDGTTVGRPTATGNRKATLPIVQSEPIPLSRRHQVPARRERNTAKLDALEDRQPGNEIAAPAQPPPAASSRTFTQSTEESGLTSHHQPSSSNPSPAPKPGQIAQQGISVRHDPEGPPQAAPQTKKNPEAGTRPPSEEPGNHGIAPTKKKDPYDDAPVLRDDRLKVYAIAWSPKAQDRVAVMNSRVLYEGDVVDGFIVVAIRPEDVVVREKDNGLWRVIFGRP